MNISELTPGTLEKNGIQFAPRTLASLVYMDDGTKVSDVMKGIICDGKKFILKSTTDQMAVEYDKQRIYDIPAPLENYDYEKYSMLVSLNGQLIESVNYSINDTQLILGKEFSNNVHKNDVLMFIFHYLDIIIENTGVNAEYVNDIRYFVDKYEPRHKRLNDVWFDTTFKQVKQFNGEQWEVIVNGTGGSGGGSTINTSLGVFKSTKAISTKTSTVYIDIPEFRKSTDTLFVYVNSTYLEEGQDYNISSDSSRITTVNGSWDGSEDTQLFNFIVFKNVVKAFDGINGNLLLNNTITTNKLSTDLIELLGKIGQPVLPTSIPAKLIEQDYEHKFVTDDMIDILKSYKQTIANLTSRIEKLENA